MEDRALYKNGGQLNSIIDMPESADPFVAISLPIIIVSVLIS